MIYVAWTQLDSAESTAAATAADSRLCARIRPNRMRVSTSLPMEEELAAIKRKKKVTKYRILGNCIIQLQPPMHSSYLFTVRHTHISNRCRKNRNCAGALCYVVFYTAH